MTRNLLTAAFLICCSALLQGQSAPVPWFASGTLVIGGRVVNCGDTITIYDENLTDAIRPDGKGHILLNPRWFAGAPPLLQLWRYGHECGHYMAGKDESAADCWAVKYGEKQKWFSVDDLPRLRSIFASDKLDADHTPSQQRVDAMERCFVTRMGT